MEETLDAPRDQVGGKAASLARLAAAGVRVPPFFVVPSATFESAAGPVGEQVLKGYAALSARVGHGVVAVRSSGADEDSPVASFAGQFTSVLGVSGGPALLEALAAVRESSRSQDAASYRAARGLHSAPQGFGVVVQSQVFADKAGVLFTRHPLETGEDLAYLEANFGTGETVVGGLVTPDSFTVSRDTRQVVDWRIGSKKRMSVVSENEPGSRTIDIDPARRRLPALSTTEAEEIVEVGLGIEELMGGPQDIEWAMDAGGLWILQARSQTGAAR